MRTPATEQQITDWIIEQAQQRGQYEGSFIACFWFIRHAEADPAGANWDINLARTEGCVSGRCKNMIERVILPLARAQFTLVANGPATPGVEGAASGLSKER